MTDEMKRLRDELHNAEPRLVARAKGMNAAMAAFEEEFSGAQTENRPSALVTPLRSDDIKDETVKATGEASVEKEQTVGTSEKNLKTSQGSDSHRRLKGQNAPRGGTKVRRRSMTSRLPTINMMFGGTAVAAGLAALVVLPNIKGELSTDFSNADALRVDQAKLETLVRQPVGKSSPADALTDSFDAAALPELEAESTAVIESFSESDNAIVSASRKVAENVDIAAPSAAPAVATPQPSATIRTRTSLDSEEAKVLSRVEPSDQPTNTDQAQGRDRFEKFSDYQTLQSATNPVSTFSVDVDTASYSFMRASLNRGQLPDPASVRVEELINYFPYQYEAPTDAKEPFKANVTVTPTPWNADTKLMHIGIKGYTPPADVRPNSNIVLLIDTSGSMNNPNKLPLLINSFKLLLDTLDENDTVSIVTYAGSAGTVLEPTPANERSKIIAAFDRLRAGGSTAGAAGLELAYNKAQESFDEDGINRVIFATDGDFNVGFSTLDEMKSYVEKKRKSGVFLSVLGFGMGNYNDHLMQTLAQNGNGVAAYIDTLSEARKVLADEAGGALLPIAKDVKIQVEFNPAQISEYRLIGYETRALKREDFNNDIVDAGEIGSGHTVTAIYELTPKGSPAELVNDLRYAEAEAQPVTDTDASDEYAFVKIRYKLPDENTSRLISRTVDALDEADSLDAADQETRFAASVAAFAQMLRGSSRLGEYGYDDLIKLASSSKGKDEFGYRSEFINLVRLAKSLDGNR